MLSIRWGMLLIVLGLAGASEGLQAAARQEVTEEDLKKESQEAFEAAKHYSAQQRDAFHKHMQAELDEMQRKIDDLKRQAGTASEKARIEADKRIRKLEKDKERASRKLKELQAAGEEAWGDLKSGMNAALKDLQRSYNRARSRLP